MICKSKSEEDFDEGNESLSCFMVLPNEVPKLNSNLDNVVYNFFYDCHML